MNQQLLHGEWNVVKGKMKQAWGKLTDNDMKVIEGDHQEIFGRLEKYYGYNRDQAKKAIKELLDN